MDDYPEGSLDHNVPFLVASGLSSAESRLDLPTGLTSYSQLVKSSLPLLDTKESQILDKYLNEVDARGKSWTSVPREEPYRLRVKTVGRSYHLPPRKAALPDAAENPKSALVVHSPFSPLSHVSTLYPDGLINSQWIKKHQALVPSIYLCFYALTNDNHLKSDINEIKATFARSGFKTRVAIVFLGAVDDGTAELTEGVQDRLEGIRKGTALDPKSIFFVPVQESAVELTRVFDNILASLFTVMVEYYRDLGRHARKKRARGIVPQPTIPPTSGTSHTLSLSEWNFRYDFKIAVLAEFRQELDAAIRSFEQAYEILLGQDILDVIPSWSRRWDEARQLADIISIRCLRLHLWMGHTSLAVRRWQVHRDRIGDFVERRGHGMNTYGWQAWEARWATLMALLIERVEVPGLVPASASIFLAPEKAVLGERLHPWEHLHHTGYWYRLAARHLAARRTLARAMADEDRQAPEPTPAKAPTTGSHDTYMCPPPWEEYPLSGEGGVDHAQRIIDCLLLARTQFEARKQMRMAAELSLECAKELVSSGSWEAIVAILRPVWEDSLFRKEGWLAASEDVCWALRRAAQQSGKADLVIALDWELLGNIFPKRQHWHYDFSRSLEGMLTEERPSIRLSDATSSALISSSFAFRHKESRAGEFCQAQLVLESNAIAGSSPITLSAVRVEFDGNLKPVVINHRSPEEAAASNDHIVVYVALAEETSGEDLDATEKLKGYCDLTLGASQKRVLNMRIPLREPGDVKASSVIAAYGHDSFDVEYATHFKEADAATGWYVEGLEKPRQTRADTQSLHIEPRPPKLQMRLLEPETQYYTDELIELFVELRNEEEDAALVKLEVQLLGQSSTTFKLQVEGQDTAEHGRGPDDTPVMRVTVGSVEKGARKELRLIVSPIMAPTILETHLSATYHLASDPATPILQVLSIQTNIVSPFEANYDLVPRLHADPWPSLFDYDAVMPGSGVPQESMEPKGLAQQWTLLCHYASFASQDLCVTGMEMQVVSCTGAARCTVVNQPRARSAGEEGGEVVSPRTMHETQFDLVVQKLTLDDPQSVTLDLAFVIKWNRAHSSADRGTINTTMMPVGQYSVLGMEPRVLATVLHSDQSASPRLLRLDLTIENPSGHFLTFGLGMDSSDEFGFSGPKQTTLHLLPLSRRTVQFRLLPYVQGDYIRPGLTVRDKYFQKVLRVIPTEGMKIDKDGLLVWVPRGQEDAEMA